jgi:hypothetical protein
MWYSHNNEYPEKDLPFRITLSNGQVRTDPSSFTQDELVSAGFTTTTEPPSFNSRTHKLTWTGTEWQVIELTSEELTVLSNQEWITVRNQRDELIRNIEWKVFRNLSETRLGVTTTTDNLSQLDTYIQELRDITSQSDPFAINWPSDPTDPIEQ